MVRVRERWKSEWMRWTRLPFLLTSKLLMLLLRWLLCLLLYWSLRLLLCWPPIPQAPRRVTTAWLALLHLGLRRTMLIQ